MQKIITNSWFIVSSNISGMMDILLDVWCIQIQMVTVMTTLWNVYEILGPGKQNLNITQYIFASI